MIVTLGVQNAGRQVLHLVHHALTVMSHLMGMENVIIKLIQHHVLMAKF